MKEPPANFLRPSYTQGRKNLRGGSSIQEGQALKGSRITASWQPTARCGGRGRRRSSG